MEVMMANVYLNLQKQKKKQKTYKIANFIIM